MAREVVKELLGGSGLQETTSAEMAGSSRLASSAPVALAASAATASAPVKAWTVLFGTSYWDLGHALSTGLDGAIYVAGWVEGSDYTKDYFDGLALAGGYDVYLTKFTTDGTKVWTAVLGSNKKELAFATTTGQDGAIYVSGSTAGHLDGQTNRGGEDAFLSKYSPDGSKAWTRLLGTSEADMAMGLTTGLDGSIYVGGSTMGSLDGQVANGNSDFFLTKFASDGTKVWTKVLGTSGADLVAGMVTGLDGAIYVSGSTEGALAGQTNSGGVDGFFAKYSPDGTLQWIRQFGTSGEDIAYALTIGLDGAIYVGGETNGPLDGETPIGETDGFLAKYDADGTRQWTRLVGTAVDENAYALTTGLDGSIFVGGASRIASGGRDAFVTQYSVDGMENESWTLSSNYDEFVFALTTGVDGSVFASGATKGDTFEGQLSAGRYDAFLTKFQVSASTPTALPPLLGSASADTLSPRAGSENIDGGAGLDTLVYAGSKATYQLSKSTTNFVVTNPTSGDADTLSNVERLRFTDVSVALDMATTLSGGQTALLLGAVLGPGSLTTKKPLVGAVLDLFDQGYTLEQLCGAVMRLPIWGALANGGQADASSTQIATYLLTTVNGSAPDAVALASAVSSLANDPQGTLLWQLAESSANQLQVGLVGLMTTGLEYSV